MPSSIGTADGADDAVTLMEKAIDAVFVLKRKVREADERARQQQEETRVSSFACVSLHQSSNKAIETTQQVPCLVSIATIYICFGDSKHLNQYLAS